MTHYEITVLTKGGHRLSRAYLAAYESAYMGAISRQRKNN